MILVLLLISACSSGCGDAIPHAETQIDSTTHKAKSANLRAQTVALDARVDAIEARIESIVEALSVHELTALRKTLNRLSEQLYALGNQATLVSLDPLFCLKPSDPEYPQAMFAVYEYDALICGILP